jgi:hypothetical protein
MALRAGLLSGLTPAEWSHVCPRWTGKSRLPSPAQHSFPARNDKNPLAIHQIIDPIEHTEGPLGLVEYCRPDIFVPASFLYCPDIIPCFKQMGRTTVAKSRTTRRLGESCLPHSRLYCPLQDQLVNGMAPDEAWPWSL